MVRLLLLFICLLRQPSLVIRGGLKKHVTGKRKYAHLKQLLAKLIRL